MSLTLLDTLLWAAGSLLNAALLCVLLLRGRFRTLPWFTTWIAFGSLFNLACYLTRQWGSHGMYAVVYWTGAFVDMLLQIAVILEIARLVLMRRGRWVDGAARRLLIIGALGTGLAASLALADKPVDSTGLVLWSERGNIFAAVIVCSLFTGVVAVSQQLGLGWRSHAIRVGYGLTAWALVAFAVDALHGYFGPHHYAESLNHVQDCVFVASLLYWIATLWREEPPLKNIAPPARIRVAALGNELQFGPSGGSSAADRVLRK